MLITSINLWGVLLSAIAAMLIGAIWYSPLLFGKKWMELVGMRPENMEVAKAKAKKSYTISFVGALIMAYVLALVIDNFFIIHLHYALLAGFLMWLGFVVTTTISEYLFIPTPKPWMLYILNNSYHLVVLLMMSVILYFFK